MQDFIVLDKKVGETPLQCAEAWRAEALPAYKDLPLAYAGRLDPMASGKLLVLIGEECKKQSSYHNLDKEYEFEVLLGVKSDTGDVLGLLTNTLKQEVDLSKINKICQKLTGQIELPYPHFSSKTVKGKPLHVWTLENRLDEIEIPTKTSNIYKLNLINSRILNMKEIYNEVCEKIETIPTVTETSKALGNDFRRPLVRESWKNLYQDHQTADFTLLKFRCICSSGTYMRTLAGVIGKELGSSGLAYSIHRTKIGKFVPLPFKLGFWEKLYK